VLSNDWSGQASLHYYDYAAEGRYGIPDRADANLSFSYRDTLTFGLSTIRVDGDRNHRLRGAADLDASWPLSRHLSLSAGVGIAQVAVASYRRGRSSRYTYRYPPRVRGYGYGNLGLAWSDGPWRLQLDRNANSLGKQRPAYGGHAAPAWVATLSRSF
jgi:hypothetical protein